MTFAELRTTVRRRLDETTPGTFATDDEIDAAINVSYAEVSDETEWCETSRIVDRLAVRPWYDGRLVLSDKLLTIGAAFNETTNRWLLPTRKAELDRADRRWERHQTEPMRLLVSGLWWFGYWPYVPEDGGTIRQYFTRLPDALAEETDEPGFPDQFHLGLVEGALSELWADDAETSYALQAWQAYLGYETGLQQWVNDRASVPRMRGMQ